MVKVAYITETRRVSHFERGSSGNREVVSPFGPEVVRTSSASVILDDSEPFPIGERGIQKTREKP